MNYSDEVYVAAARPKPLYSDVTLTPGTTTIKAAHITELRAAIDAVW